MATVSKTASVSDRNRMGELRDVTKRVIQDMNYAAALHANLERLGKGGSVATVFDNTPHVKALNVIYQALLDQLVLVLMRLYDRSKDAAALPSLERLLRDEDVRASLIAEAGRRWPSPLGLERTHETARKRLADIVKGVENVRKRKPFKAWMNSLRSYRDTFIAHSLDKKIEQPPVYGSIEAVLEETLEIGDSLRLVVCHEARHSKQALRARKGEAACFWDAAVRGMRSPQPSFES